MKYKYKQLLSILLAGTLFLGNPTDIYGAYNGSSGAGGGTASSGGGNGGKPLITGLDIKNQFFSYNLYFLEMPSEYLGNKNDKVLYRGADGKDVEITKGEARNRYWTDNAGKAIKIGKEVLVSRDGFKKAGTDKKTSAVRTYSGDIVSAYGQLKDKPYQISRFSDTGINFVNASDIGLPEGDKFPIYMSKLNNDSVPVGYSTFDYFMEKNPNYVAGESAEFKPKEAAKNLIRYIAGVDNGLARVSFKDDPQEVTVAGKTYKFNSNSVFDDGTYNGMTGEFKVFCEAGAVANGIAYTTRELVDYEMKSNYKDALIYNLNNNLLGNMTNKVYLTENDAFNLKARGDGTAVHNTSDYIKYFNLSYRDKYLGSDGNLGKNINIISSELFRDPVQRTIGTHSNIFLDSGDAISFEYVGNGTNVSVSDSEGFKKLIENNELDTVYLSQVDGIGLGGLGTNYVLDFVKGSVQDSFVRGTLDKASQTNTGTYMTIAGVMELSGKDVGESNSVLATGIDTLSKDRAQGVQLLDDSIHAEVKATDDGSGALSGEAKKLLNKNAYVNPDGDYVDVLKSYDSKGLKFVPVAAGGTVMKVAKEKADGTVDAAVLPKGVLKDVISETMDVVGNKLVGEYASGNGASRSVSGSVGDITSEVLGSSVSQMASRGMGTSRSLGMDNSLVTSTLLDGASYGTEVDGKVQDRSINTYKVNSIVENTLSLSGMYGENSINIDAYEGTSFNSNKSIKDWVHPSTKIEPYRFFGGEINDNLDSMVVKAEEAKAKEVNHIEGAKIDKYYNSASIATRNDNSIDSQSEYIQDASDMALNSVLPKTLSEIGDERYYKNSILGNYGSSYIVWDVGIPVDIIVMSKDSSGKLKVLDGVKNGKDGYAILTDQWYIPAGTERILAIPDQIKLKLADGDMVLKPEEVVIKPACVRLDEFIKAYEPVAGKKDAKLDFGNNLVSTVRQAPFNYKTNEASRALGSGTNGTKGDLAGMVTHYINNGTGGFNGALGVVASECDKTSHISDPMNNRMALVVTVDIKDSNVTQYNIIETRRNGELVSTEVIKTKPKYDTDGDVILEEVLDDAKQQEWVTSEKDETPKKWEDVENNIPPNNSSEVPTTEVPQVDKDGDGEKDKDNIYVRYEKDAKESKLRLTEKRISWQKNLKDLGGIPDVTFRWDAVDGVHIYYDDCGSEDSPCPGHECYEYLADDTFFRFVATNIIPVDESVIGNIEPFTSKNSDNIHEVTRGSDAGEYTMSPNYWYTIWRGDDKPTVAKYKYDDAKENRQNADEVLRLLGKEQEGIENVSERHSTNHGNYIKNTSFNITKSNYDTGTMGALNGHYGTGNANDAGALYDEDVDKWEWYRENEYEETELLKRAKDEYKKAKDYYDKVVNIKIHLDATQDDASHVHDVWACFYGDYDIAYGRVDINDALDKANKDFNRESNELAEAEARYNKFMGDMAAAWEKIEAVGVAVGGNIGDYNYNTNWEHHDNLQFFDANGTGQVYDIEIQVDVEYGESNDISKQQRNNASSTTFKTADGTVWNNAKGNNLHNSIPLEYTPYVEMYYDTVGSNKKNVPVYTLGGHKSTMLSNDYIEIGYNTYGKGEHKTGLILTSEQWSTHSKASSLGGTETVLPGGAIYKLNTPNGEGLGRTKLAVSSWQTVIPDDVASGIVNEEAKKYYSLAEVQKRNNDLFYKIVKSLNSLDVIQYVDGKEILQSDTSSDTPSGQPLSKDKKYWLQQGNKDGSDGSYANATSIGSVKPNEGDLDITDRKQDTVMYYRVYADVNGNVTVKKGNTISDTAPDGKGTAIASIKKSDGIDKLLANAEVAELDNKTKLVSNFVNTLDRNTGNDVSLADGKWYNEAWDGVVVMKTDRILEVGFNDNKKDVATRSAALDPKLTPMKANQYELYTDKVNSYFGTRSHTNLTDKDGYVGTISGQYDNGNKTNVEIYMGDMTGIYRSKDFVIPNATVMDLH